MAEATHTMAYTRRRPLHTCCISALAIAHIIYSRTLEIDGPLGYLPRALAKRGSFLKPAIGLLLYHLLALLSLVDDYALAVAMIITSRMPSSYGVFNRLDKAFFLVEKLPEKLDDLMMNIPLMLHRVPLIEQVVHCAIKWLNSLIVMLTMGAFNSANEKETRDDSDAMAEEEEFSSVSKLGGDEDQKDAMRTRRQDSSVEESFLYTEDPVLQLFEEGWQAPRTGSGSFMLSSNASLL